MSNCVTVETITKRPPAGLNVLEMAVLGSLTATEKVIQVLPELSSKPPSGLSVLEWARLGLPSAIEKVQNAVSTTNQ